MRYGMYLVDVTQPFFKVISFGTHHRLLGDGCVGRTSALTNCSLWSLQRKAPNAGATGSFFVMLTLLIVKQ